MIWQLSLLRSESVNELLVELYIFTMLQMLVVSLFHIIAVSCYLKKLFSDMINCWGIFFSLVSIYFRSFGDQGAISLKLSGGKLAPKLAYFVLRKELLKP